MATIQFTSPRTPEQVTRAIMTLCPGGPVGKVMSEQGRLLLPRRMSADRVVIERRKPGLPSGRIIVGFSPTPSGTAVVISPSAHAGAFIVPAAVIAVLTFVAAQLAGAIVGAVVAAGLIALESLRWRKGLAGVRQDAAWLANELG